MKRLDYLLSWIPLVALAGFIAWIKDFSSIFWILILFWLLSFGIKKIRAGELIKANWKKEKLTLLPAKMWPSNKFRCPEYYSALSKLNWFLVFLKIKGSRKNNLIEIKKRLEKTILLLPARMWPSNKFRCPECQSLLLRFKLYSRNIQGGMKKVDTKEIFKFNGIDFRSVYPSDRDLYHCLFCEDNYVMDTLQGGL